MVLQVHVYTLRNEDRYLAWDFAQDVHNAFDFYLRQQVDGIFTDFPQSLAWHLDAVDKKNKTSIAPYTTNNVYTASIVIAVIILVVCFPFI